MSTNTNFPMPAFTDDLELAKQNGYYYSSFTKTLHPTYGDKEMSLYIDINQQSSPTIMPATHISYNWYSANPYFNLSVTDLPDAIKLQSIIIKHTDVQWLKYLLIIIINYIPECKTQFYIYNSVLHNGIGNLEKIKTINEIGNPKYAIDNSYGSVTLDAYKKYVNKHKGILNIFEDA